MKQIIQNYKTGILDVKEVPLPSAKATCLLVKTKCSIISTGTERSKVLTASKNIILKAKQRPDQVKLVVNNLKQEGLIPTIKKTLIKLNSPISLGYSCAGEIIKVGDRISNFKIGDKVACIGEGFATHAEIDCVPENLCIRIPDNLSYKEACFAGLGAIAMQGYRNAYVDKHHKVGVIGLGLIGQLIAQIIKAYGYEVIGIDLDENKLSLLKELKIPVGNPQRDDIESLVRQFTDNKGLDAIIIAAASKNNKPIELAGRIAAKYAYVVLVGLVPIQIPRTQFFDKELTFIVSHGFGDETLQKEVIRNNRRTIWSARRNAGEFLSLVSKGAIKLDRLITHEFNINEAQQAYRLISSRKENILGIIINYDSDVVISEQKIPTAVKTITKKSIVNIGFIGAGSFSIGYLLPIFVRNKHVNLIGVSTSRGISSMNIANKFKFNYATTESRNILKDPNINCIVVATRHNLHSNYVIEGFKKGKIVFVEKPLCINGNELEQIINTYKETNGKLMIGFNRRFSPFVIKLKDFFKNRIGPLIINYRINAGYLDDSHWLNDLTEGGGRIIGEVCHFVDLLQHITESNTIRVFAETTDKNEKQKSQSLVITIKYEDNSIGTINYNSIGDISYPRERIEVFGQDSVCTIDNFQYAEFTRKNRTKKIMKLSRDMGYENEIRTFVDCILNNKNMPIEFGDIVNSTYLTFKIIDSLKTQQPIQIIPREFNHEK
jgi:predicted dehydrogenase